MLRIIDGKRYDTETATLICDISPNDFHYDDFRYQRIQIMAFRLAHRRVSR